LHGAGQEAIQYFPTSNVHHILPFEPFKYRITSMEEKGISRAHVYNNVAIAQLAKIEKI
jgi:hypothetical protein